MGGKERETLGSKCIAGLQVMSCARAQINNDASSNSDSNNSSSSSGNGGDWRAGNYGSNNIDSNRRKSDGSGSNKIHSVVNSNSTREQGSSSSISSSGTVGSKEEHILIFKRPLKSSDEDAGEKFTTGDRVIISLEMESQPLRACKGPPIKEQSVSIQSTHSVDIEDLGSVNKNSRICSSSSSSSSASKESDDLSAPYLVEPHIITGQIVKISLTAIHISVRERPRRFLRYE